MSKHTHHVSRVIDGHAVHGNEVLVGVATSHLETSCTVGLIADAGQKCIDLIISGSPNSCGVTASRESSRLSLPMSDESLCQAFCPVTTSSCREFDRVVSWDSSACAAIAAPHREIIHKLNLNLIDFNTLSC